MAERAVKLVATMIVELLREGLARLRPATQQALAHLREASVPPPGVLFTSEDCAAYTGIVLLDRNRVVALLAAHTEPPLIHKVPHPERLPHREQSPLAMPLSPPPQSFSSSQRSFYEREFDRDEPDWDEHEHGGYHRYKLVRHLPEEGLGLCWFISSQPGPSSFHPRGFSMRITGRTLRASTSTERRLLLSLGSESLHVPRRENPFRVARKIEQLARTLDQELGALRRQTRHHHVPREPQLSPSLDHPEQSDAREV